MVDPEGNVTEYTYFSEQDPDGDGVPTPPPADGRTLDATTGGYLAATAVDTTSSPGRDSGTNPTPANIRTSYTYDDVGNVTSMTDGRGITTDYFVNELNQVVQTTSAAAVPASGPGNPSEPLPLTAFAYIAAGSSTTTTTTSSSARWRTGATPRTWTATRPPPTCRRGSRAPPIPTRSAARPMSIRSPSTTSWTSRSRWSRRCPTGRAPSSSTPCTATTPTGTTS